MVQSGEFWHHISIKAQISIILSLLTGWNLVFEGNGFKKYTNSRCILAQNIFKLRSVSILVLLGQELLFGAKGFGKFGSSRLEMMCILAQIYSVRFVFALYAWDRDNLLF